jgi:hypothetical protein
MNLTDDDAVFDEATRRSPRLKLIRYSFENPDMLNARMSSSRGIHDVLFTRNETNGFHRVLPFDPIPEQAYFSNYQVALVLPGIGAAFRTSVHFSTQTAVMLQDCIYTEWFVKYLVPYRHYIPLQADLSDAQVQLQWVRDNADRVRQIAEEGHRFYEQFLSFEQNRRHMHEFLFKLSVQQQQQQQQEVEQQQ